MIDTLAYGSRKYDDRISRQIGSSATGEGRALGSKDERLRLYRIYWLLVCYKGKIALLWTGFLPDVY